MAKCKECGAIVFAVNLTDGYCQTRYNAAILRKYSGDAPLNEARHSDSDETCKADQIILTTETAHNLPVAQRLDIVTAEVVIGMHLFKDVASAFRDVFGGRSETMQRGLKQGRKAALAELRQEAFDLGADAVVGVDLDYSEISGGGKSMLFLVASGTAVKLHPPA